MIITRESPWSMLHFGLLVLLALQAALIAARVVSAGPDGALVGKLRPNGVIGLRVPWTLASRLAWDRAHRTLGRALFWIGLAGLASSLSIPPTLSMPLIFAAVVSAVALALIEARSAWRSDPERGRRPAR